MSVESFGAMPASHLKFPEDLTSNPDYAGHYIMFTAMKVSGGVDTRTLIFALESLIILNNTGNNFSEKNDWNSQLVRNAFWEWSLL